MHMTGKIAGRVLFFYSQEPHARAPSIAKRRCTS